MFVNTFFHYIVLRTKINIEIFYVMYNLSTTFPSKKKPNYFWFIYAYCIQNQRAISLKSSDWIDRKDENL